MTADQMSTPFAAGPAVHPIPVVACWLCGTRLPQHQMMADGSSACDDIRWYCQDTAACTERWTSAGRRAPDAGLPHRANR